MKPESATEVCLPRWLPLVGAGVVAISTVVMAFIKPPEARQA